MWANSLPTYLSLFSFEGVYNDEVPPVPIPNTEVKLISADDTWLETARENRSSPSQTRTAGSKRELTATVSSLFEGAFADIPTRLSREKSII